ncbi:MAG TPA: hypothetical protein VK943_12565, partial [Arenibaculum sp.]|nr:hypothetical protein [Arenibaculum sp.]
MILALPAGAQPADAPGASFPQGPVGRSADGRSDAPANLVDEDEEDEEDEDEDEADEDDPLPAGGPVRVTIGGSATLQAGFGGDVAGDVEFRNDVDVYLSADGRMDNGLLYGARIEVESRTEADATPRLSYDDAYGYL